MDLSWCGIAIANLEDVKNYLILNFTFPITIYYHRIFLTAYNFFGTLVSVSKYFQIF